MGNSAESSEKTWQQTKSENTRSAVLEAAVDCFYDLGYANTTTEKISRRAGVSRGAMLHHFPTRFDLIKAAVEHLNELRLATFADEESRIHLGAENSRIEEGIDACLERYDGAKWRRRVLGMYRWRGAISRQPSAVSGAGLPIADHEQGSAEG
mgnify:CR=1 FL=1